MKTRIKLVGQRRLIRIGLALAALQVAIVAARYILPRVAPRMMEFMAENVMPRMIDTCFGQMSEERRTSMLAHCRGMLDQAEAKYRAMRPAQPFEVA